MNRTIKRTITITITETWTIVWTDVDDPVPPAPVTLDEAPAAPPVNPNNTLSAQPRKGPGPENDPPAPGEMVQPPDEWPVSATADGPRKQVRRPRAQDKPKRPADENHPLFNRLE